MTANMNAYLDLVMMQVGPWIHREGWIPFGLPDLHERIEHRVLLVTYTGELYLRNGQMTRLVSVARHGTATMTWQNNMLRIVLAASVRQIQVSHKIDQSPASRALYRLSLRDKQALSLVFQTLAY